MRRAIPPAVRYAVLRRAGGNCECCGDRVRLDMHHLTYFRPDGMDEIFGFETPGDLQALCRACHDAEHHDINGDYWRDPQEMETYWSTFWNAD